MERKSEWLTLPDVDISAIREEARRRLEESQSSARMSVAVNAMVKALGFDPTDAGNNLAMLLGAVEDAENCVVKLDRAELETIFNDFYGPDAIFMTSAEIDLKNRSVKAKWVIPKENAPTTMTQHFPGGESIVKGMDHLEAMLQSGLLFYKLMYPNIQPLASDLPKASESSDGKIKCMLKLGDTAIIETQMLEDPRFNAKRMTGKMTGVSCIYNEKNPEGKTTVEISGHLTSKAAIERMKRMGGKA